MQTEFTLDQICDIITRDTERNSSCDYYPASVDLAYNLRRLRDEVNSGVEN